MAEPDDITAVNALPPVQPIRAGSARRVRWTVALVLAWAVLAVADIVIFHSGLDLHAAAESEVKPGVRAPGHAEASASSHPTSKRTPVVRPGRALVPVSASAIGPAGLGSGDNPQNAYRAIDASMATAWVTDWYGTAQFAGLKAGTGLLIDMGHPVKITSVQIVLGSAHGADLELFAGKVPILAKQRLQASVSDAGGRVRLKLARPERARYLIVWFTLLPPDSSGTFRASVHSIRIYGRS